MGVLGRIVWPMEFGSEHNVGTRMRQQMQCSSRCTCIYISACVAGLLVEMREIATGPMEVEGSSMPPVDNSSSGCDPVVSRASHIPVVSACFDTAALESWVRYEHAMVRTQLLAGCDGIEESASPFR
jgi:hypothetical protein